MGLALLASPLEVGTTLAVGGAVFVGRAVGRFGALGRGLLEMLLGVTGLVVGVGVGVWHVVRSGITPEAVVGLVVLVAGLVLVLGARQNCFSTVPTWWRLTAIPAAFLLFQFGLVPVTPTVAAVGRPTLRARNGDAGQFSLSAADVELSTADGVRLPRGACRRNGAAVVVLHGSGSARSAVLPQAAALAGQGYGTLLYDDQGHGRSEETAMDFGWWGTWT